MIDADVVPRNRDDFVLGVSSKATQLSGLWWGDRESERMRPEPGVPGLVGGRVVQVLRDLFCHEVPRGGVPGCGRGWGRLVQAEDHGGDRGVRGQ